MNQFWLFMLLGMTSFNALAQSCCCTGSGSNYTILPNLNRHVIGTRYTYRNFYNKTSSLNPDLDGQVTNQHQNSIELFGRFNLTSRLQLSVFLPFSFILQESAGETKNSNGLGDMSFLLQYNLLNPMLCTGKSTKHQIRLGAGTKLPSGNFQMGKNDLFYTNLQLGSGSVDFLANVVYTLRYKNLGFNTIVAYRFNTINPQQYRFGDKTQAGTNMFYIIQMNELQLMPSVGFSYEHQSINGYKEKPLTYTGGDFLTALIGFDVYYKNFAFSSAFTPALMNHLNWSGENKNKFNIEAGVFYNFSTKNKNNKS